MVDTNLVPRPINREWRWVSQYKHGIFHGTHFQSPVPHPKYVANKIAITSKIYTISETLVSNFFKFNYFGGAKSYSGDSCFMF